jgi:hypothetical protein
MTPFDQLRLRLTDHDFYRLMETAKPLAALDRDAFLKEVAAELGRHEVVGPGLLHRIISEVQMRYNIADQRRDTAEDPMMLTSVGEAEGPGAVE